MLTDEVPEEVIDEDLEALLYAQVYYGKPGDDSPAEPLLLESLPVEGPPLVEEHSSSSLSQPEPDLELQGSYKNIIKKNKTAGQYLQNFSNQEDKEIDVGTNPKPDSPSNPPEVNSSTPPPQQYVEISTSTAGQGAISPTQVVTQIPVLSTSTPNNITINQYFYPTDNFLNHFNYLKKRLRWTDKCEENYQRLQEGSIKPKTFLRLLRQQARHQKRKAKRYAKLQEKIQISKANLAVKEVICVSDSDNNSDVEIVEGDMQPKDKSEEEDEIIYVEPPPVPVISLEDDSGAESEHIDVVTCEAAPQDDASNDFLGPADPLEKENFNFSLHGSDFQEVEFARPANPSADVYETESSTSTSDFNRDSSRSFSNSVKTIVFSEVDFPKDDIFEGGNLEKFDDLITPRREAEVPAERPKEKEKSGKTRRVTPKTGSSSESSSESDYDYSETHKNLPDLSPMITADDTPRKSAKKLKKASSQLLEQDESEEPRSKMTRSKSAAEEEPETPKKKFKKKKKKKPDEEEEPEQSEPESAKKKAKKPKRKSSKELEEPENNDKKTKKGKTKPPSESEEKKKTKKKKRDKESEESEDALKKKAKKRKQKPTEEPPLQEEQPEEDKTKKKKRTSLETPFDGEVTEEEVEEREAEILEVPQRPEGRVIVEEDRGDQEEGSREDGELVEEEEDIVLIEPVVPVHTIESSSDSEDDILTFEDLSDELVLANIKTPPKTAEKPSEEPAWAEQFDVATLQKTMSDDPEKWKVAQADVSYVPNRDRIRRRCARCRQMGHLAVNCTNKSSVPVCSLCGKSGHQEPRCPNKICLSCANPGNYSLVYCYKCAKLRKRKCDTCHLEGHTSSSCPDSWRRYYLTTTEGPLVKPQTKKLTGRKWCSGCASSGHLEHECTSYKWIREYPAASPQIFHYQELYNRNKTNKEKQDSNSSDLRQKTTNTPRKEPVTSTITSQEAAEPPPSPPPAATLDFIPPQTHLNFTPPPPPRGRRPRVNPFSMMHSTRYTPYNSLIHPNNQRNTPPFTFSGTPSLTDFEVPYNGATSSSSQNHQMSLFNSVPPHLMAQQVSNLWSSSVHQVENTVTSYQTNYGGGGEYNYTQDSYFAGRTNQFDQQRIPSLTHYGEQHSRVNFGTGQLSQLSQIQSNYIDFSLPLPPPTYNPPPDNIFTLSTEPNRENLNARAIVSTSTPETIPPLNPPLREVEEAFIPLSVNSQNRDKNYPKKLNNVDETTKQKFLNFPIGDLVQLLEDEIKKLTDIKPNETRMFKKRLSGVEQLKSIEIKTNSVKKQICFQYKRFNMYLFGVRQLDEGKKHLDYLRNFVRNGGKTLSESKRLALLEAYGYVFGGEHPGLDYAKYLKRYVPLRNFE
ncbi:uncharacterized protein LOC126747244 [Anthonomus grandis grandis]|uniref:uncharacterized protein LOC126747244 n=1 Tax=Anthonomus grandis grandis TaxID=2921223 RepID=UPI0021651ACB|nr:uncharacterized protein LOC126747244 [Anthonomus grandis grandis]